MTRIEVDEMDIRNALKVIDYLGGLRPIPNVEVNIPIISDVYNNLAGYLQQGVKNEAVV